MFKNKKLVDVTEFELIKIRVKNLEKQLFKLKKKAPQTDAEERKKAFDEWYKKQLTKTVKELHRIANS